MKELILSVILLSLTQLCANTAPVVSNMSAAQRADGSFLVDVYYSVEDTDSALLTISLMVSSDGGTSWNVSCDLLSGDIGANISPGSNKHIIWNLGTEHPNIEANYHFKVTAVDEYEPPVPVGFVSVPGGTFIMGRTTGTGISDQLPTHNVILSSFYIGRYEVTQAEYAQYMQPSLNWTNDLGIGDYYPAYYVSWYAILKYCNLRSMAEGLTPVYCISSSTDPANWGAVPTSSDTTWNAAICNWTANGYRLPTEAEWEYAARGVTNIPDYLFSGSDEINAVAWYSGNNAPNGSKPVGTKDPNGVGLYDMSGNVWEWCWDWYSSSYYSSSPSNNPTGAESGEVRVSRGGSWYWGNYWCNVSRRYGWRPRNSIYYLGFRLCRSIL